MIALRWFVIPLVAVSRLVDLLRFEKINVQLLLTLRRQFTPHIWTESDTTFIKCQSMTEYFDRIIDTGVWVRLRDDSDGRYGVPRGWDECGEREINFVLSYQTPTNSILTGELMPDKL